MVRSSISPEGKKHECLYVPIGGVCNRSSFVYYYSPFEGDCKKWDGCLGRGLYFSRPRCERACRDAPHGICALEKDEGTFGVPPFEKKYFYNQITQQCETFGYQGNGEEKSRANRFDDEHECHVKCATVRGIRQRICHGGNESISAGTAYSDRIPAFSSCPSVTQSLIIGGAEGISQPACRHVLPHVEAFRKTFACPVGSPMNPTKKCELF
ncbi:hypothetical protein HPB49_017222 [Dermacentor silvarum]|uniref:Uncharacterized protein n=1 Tax=Dermacentor silvarum TaxID=543639 RepID=A0ACB8D6W8_DERSI|nr:hypothetical protein HPB49_017222 [Dermacentor silvarum]